MTKRNFNDTIEPDGIRRLQATLLVKGRCLSIYSMTVDGRDEVDDFAQALAAAAVVPGARGERADRFSRRLAGQLGVVGDLGIASPTTLLRRIVTWRDQWEIRVQQGDTNHRFYGFIVGMRELYLVRYRDKRGADPNASDLSYVEGHSA